MDFWDSFLGKFIRYIVFIPVQLFALFILLFIVSITCYITFKLSLGWFIFIMLTFGSMIVALLTMGAGLISYAVSKICPNKKLSIITFVIFTIILFLWQIILIWLRTASDYGFSGLMIFYSISMTALIITIVSMIISMSYSSLYE